MKLGLLIFIVLLGAQIGNEIKAPAEAPVIFENNGQIWLAALTLATGALTAWLTLRRDKMAVAREEKQRLWLIEDRREAQAEAERVADRVRLEVIQAQDKVAREAWMRADRVEASISENTEISREAFRAANNVNEKIAAVGALRRNDQGERRREKDDPKKSTEPQ